MISGSFQYVYGRGSLFSVALPGSLVVIDSVWELSDRPASIESILSRLPNGGEDTVESFAVVHFDEMQVGAWGEVNVTVVVKGSLCVDVTTREGVHRVAGQENEPWLSSFTSVTQISIGSELPAHDPVVGWFPLTGGVVAADAVLWARVGQCDDTVVRDTVASLEVGADDTVLRGGSRVHVAADDTVIRNSHASEADVLFDDDTVVARRNTEIIGVVEVTPGVHSCVSQNLGSEFGVCQPQFNRLSVNGAEAVSLEVPVLLGRQPGVSRVLGGMAPRLIVVNSPERRVSATHIELRQEGEVVVVTDMCSTNGTIVTFPGREPVRMGHGESLVVTSGTLIAIGDSNIIEILPL
jgi:hypothetical protein